jgi:hypothetical protein
MAVIYETSLDLSEAKQRQIGRIIACWSLLEALMVIAIGNMRGLDRKKGRRYTAKFQYSGLVKQLKKSARKIDLPSTQREKMDRLIARMKIEREFRNDVAHGFWGKHHRKWALLRYDRRKKGRYFDDTPTTARDLESIANRAMTLTEDFEKWLDTLPKAQSPG